MLGDFDHGKDLREEILQNKDKDELEGSEKE